MISEMVQKRPLAHFGLFFNQFSSLFSQFKITAFDTSAGSNARTVAFLMVQFLMKGKNGNDFNKFATLLSIMHFI